MSAEAKRNPKYSCWKVGQLGKAHRFETHDIKTALEMAALFGKNYRVYAEGRKRKP